MKCFVMHFVKKLAHKIKNDNAKIFNNRFLKERGMASIESTPKMEFQVFLCIFQKNSAMTSLALKQNGKISLGR